MELLKSVVCYVRSSSLGSKKGRLFALGRASQSLEPLCYVRSPLLLGSVEKWSLYLDRVLVFQKVKCHHTSIDYLTVMAFIALWSQKVTNILIL